MKWFLLPLLVLLLITSSLYKPQESEAAVTLIHEFAGGSNDGSRPCDGECKLVQDGEVFYGLTEGGGDGLAGTLFRVNTDGTNFTLLHEFAGGGSDGANPLGYVTQSGSVLYGMTYGGGDGDLGTIFRVNTDGTNFTLLHEFAGSSGDGAAPRGSLLLNGGVLYGTTTAGGDFGDGTVFKINTDGTGFTLLHEFETGTEDGGVPYSTLVISGSTLYGMTTDGGNSNQGVIFRVNTDGTNYSLLREFTGSASDGGLPYGSLILYQSKLYGLTNEGGDGDFGTIFQINTDGTGFTLLYEFTGGTTDGQWPGGSLIENNGKFYGTTYYGGDNDMGTIFQINANGTGYSVLHEFLGGTTDGQYTNGNVAFNTVNSRLYGMNPYGGDSNLGVIYYYQTAEPTPTPTSTPTPTNSPTPTPTSAASPTSTPSNNSSSNSLRPFVCTNQAPLSSPNLFQVNTTNNTATLYFSPAKQPYSSYYVSFGNGSSDEGYGASFNQGNTNGVITYTVSSLSQNSVYTFRVRAANGCMPGGWSKSISAKTVNSRNVSNKFFPQSVIPYTISYTAPKAIQNVKNNIPFVEKQPTIKNKPVTGVKKVVSPKPVQAKTNKSLLDRIFGIY